MFRVNSTTQFRTRISLFVPKHDRIQRVKLRLPVYNPSAKVGQIGKIISQFEGTSFREEGLRPEDGVCVLRGKEIQRIIGHPFNVRYSLSTVYQLLHRLGYSYVSSRPEHPQGNPAS